MSGSPSRCWRQLAAAHASPRRARRRLDKQLGARSIPTRACRAGVGHPEFVAPQPSRTCVSSTMCCYSASRLRPTCKAHGSSSTEARVESHDIAVTQWVPRPLRSMPVPCPSGGERWRASTRRCPKHRRAARRGHVDIVKERRKILAGAARLEKRRVLPEGIQSRHERVALQPALCRVRRATPSSS